MDKTLKEHLKDMFLFGAFLSAAGLVFGIISYFKSEEVVLNQDFIYLFLKILLIAFISGFLIIFIKKVMFLFFYCIYSFLTRSPEMSILKKENIKEVKSPLSPNQQSFNMVIPIAVLVGLFVLLPKLENIFNSDNVLHLVLFFLLLIISIYSYASIIFNRVVFQINNTYPHKLIIKYSPFPRPFSYLKKELDFTKKSITINPAHEVTRRYEKVFYISIHTRKKEHQFLRMHLEKDVVKIALILNEWLEMNSERK